MTENQFNEIGNWQSKVFPTSTVLSMLSHLQTEVNELRNDVTINSSAKTLEFADCIILIMGAAFKDGMTYDNVIDAIEAKMNINKGRKWGKPNKDGFQSHIKQETPAEHFERTGKTELRVPSEREREEFVGRSIDQRNKELEAGYNETQEQAFHQRLP